MLVKELLLIWTYCRVGICHNSFGIIPPSPLLFHALKKERLLKSHISGGSVPERLFAWRLMWVTFQFVTVIQCHVLTSNWVHQFTLLFQLSPLVELYNSLSARHSSSLIHVVVISLQSVPNDAEAIFHQVKNIIFTQIKHWRVISAMFFLKICLYIFVELSQ